MKTLSTTYSSRLPPPGILENDITSEILMLKSMGYNGVGRFDFLTPPHPEVYLRGLEELGIL